jgi:DNA-binding transcriptional MerR regulator
MMFRIGEFSRLCQVSVKTLRFYDGIGLLRPARIDEATGYRYYAEEQRTRLQQVLALKEAGFSLEEIAGVIDEGSSPGMLTAMLRSRREAIRQLIRVEKARLARVEAWLEAMDRERIEAEGGAASPVVVKEVASYTIASVRDVIPAYHKIDDLFDEVRSHLSRQGVRPAGAPFAIWYDPEYRDEEVDGEAAIPVEAAAPGSGRVAVRKLPGVATMACVIHHGGRDTFREAYTSLLLWVRAGDYRIVGPHREVYLRQPDCQDPESGITEIQFPVRR